MFEISKGVFTNIQKYWIRRLSHNFNQVKLCVTASTAFGKSPMIFYGVQIWMDPMIGRSLGSLMTKTRFQRLSETEDAPDVELR